MKTSYPEAVVIAFLNRTISNTFVIHDRTSIRNPHTNRMLELDIHFKKEKIAIEIQSSHHRRNAQAKRDYIKRRECEKRKITLLTIWAPVTVCKLHNLRHKLQYLFKKKITKIK
jgi:hypothetical protein